MIDIETIGKIIKKLRVDKNMTQETLAEKIDISTNYLSKVERGLSRLNIEAFLKMAEVLSFTLDDFGIEAKKTLPVNENKRKLLEKVLAIPERDVDLYLQTLNYIENLILKIRQLKPILQISYFWTFQYSEKTKYLI